MRIEPADKIVRILDEGARRIVLKGGAARCASFLVAGILSKSGKKVVLVAPDSESAGKMADDLSFLLNFQDQGLAVEILEGDPSPYSAAGPDRFLSSSRLAAMAGLVQQDSPLVVVTDPPGLARATVPRKIFEEACFVIDQGMALEPGELAARLVSLGYVRTPLVAEHGDFSPRGSIFDIFCPFYQYPIRFELDFDQVQSIRFFEPETQRSRKQSLKSVYICPAREILGRSLDFRSASKEIIDLGDDLVVPSSKVKALADAVAGDLASLDMECLLPAFYPRPGHVVDYVSDHALIILVDPLEIEREMKERRQKLNRAYERRVLSRDIVYPPERLELDWPALASKIEEKKSIVVQELSVEDDVGADTVVLEWDASFPFDIGRGAAGSSSRKEGLGYERLDLLSEEISSFASTGGSILIVCNSETRAEVVRKALSDRNISARVVFKMAGRGTGSRDLEQGVTVTWGRLSTGCRSLQSRLWVMTEEDLLGIKSPARPARTRMKKIMDSVSIRSFKELKPGDLVVHVDFGIAEYKGLQRVETDGLANDFLRLEFAGKDVLFLPVHAMQRIQRYVGSAGKGPALSRLGGTGWARTKARVEAAVRELARELLAVQAARKAMPGTAFPPQDYFISELEATFGFEETEDQARAIEETLRDMRAKTPMDRVICGDVGFGKTEVAMRAAFQAVLGGKQVALLAPTTILAQQHGINFRERFKAFPVNIEVLSRFRSREEQKKILERTADGNVDILIGTHRLLSKDVVFKDLGLLIVDEEHRFGVNHKEVLKKKRTQVDVLTLTATPIPRTLYMGLSGLRDLSIIATPPADRLSLKTVVMRFDEQAVRDAILAELNRGGQVFFVHNRVKSLAAVARMVQTLVPEARVAMAHGQMSERTLEKVMLDFLAQKFDVLVSTAIIESGLDIPSVNTMIINRADLFGLSQLYQIRGRIGRGRLRGYCYLMIPPAAILTREAEERLAVLQRFSDLGSGLQIAMHDLESRGAGNILGHEQSGHVSSVGLDLYSQMLEQAVCELDGRQVEEKADPDISLPVSAIIPDDYIQDTGSRLEIYKRLAKAESKDDLLDLKSELKDRFGPVPKSIDILIEVMEIRQALQEIRAKGLKVGRGFVAVNLGDRARIDAQELVVMLSRSIKAYTLAPDHTLRRPLTFKERKDPIFAAKNILLELEQCRVRA